MALILVKSKALWFEFWQKSLSFERIRLESCKSFRANPVLVKVVELEKDDTIR